jgi:hypothetical protein
MVLGLVLITAACTAYPRLDDYGPEHDLETVRVIIHPLRKRDKAMETSARAGSLAKKPKPIRNEDKPYFNSRVGVFLFQAPTLALSRKLAVMTHQHLLNERRFRFIGLIDRPAGEVGQDSLLRRAIRLGRDMGYDLVVVGECLDLFNGMTVGPSRVTLRLRILDVKRSATAWLIIGRKAVRPRPDIDTPWGAITGRPAPDATSLAHYLLRAMLEKI